MPKPPPPPPPSPPSSHSTPAVVNGSFERGGSFWGAFLISRERLRLNLELANFLRPALRLSHSHHLVTTQEIQNINNTSISWFPKIYLAEVFTGSAYWFDTNWTVFNHLWIGGKELSTGEIFCIQVKVLSLIFFSLGFFFPPNYYSFFHLELFWGEIHFGSIETFISCLKMFWGPFFGNENMREVRSALNKYHVLLPIL